MTQSLLTSMLSLISLRRYRLPALLFSLCLSIVLIFSGKAISATVTSIPTQSPEVTILASGASDPSLLTEGVQKTVLDNGLTVLTKEVHTAPVVSVQVWYKVGSRNEAPGVNGIAHQLEHLLFKGTTDRPIQFGRLFSALGSESNAFTSYDETAYFGTVERNKLKAMLTLEADRMQNSLINANSLNSEKRVVISELQGYENYPSYRLSRAIMHSAIPDHPYGLMVGGTKADVEKFTVDQVRDYYHNYYSPNNATLVVVGDFQTDTTQKWIKETFGKVSNNNSDLTKPNNLNNQSKVLFPTPPPPSSKPIGKTPIILQEPGSAALLETVYLLPDVNHPDVPALDLMDYILTGGRTSRLYQALVETGLTSDISGYVATLAEGGWYELSATATHSQDLPKIQQVLIKTIADLQEQGISSEELNRAKAQVKASVIFQNRDIPNQAMQLGNDQTTTGDYRWSDRFLAAIDQVSTSDIQRVAQNYLSIANRTEGFFEPTKTNGGLTNNATASRQTSEHFNQGPPVDPAQVAKYLPEIPKTTTSANQDLPVKITLSNGIRVLLLSDRSNPTITLSGQIFAGTEFDPKSQAGLASLTAQSLMHGTKTQDAISLSKALDDRGASLSFSANREGVSVQGNSLAPDLSVLIATFADVVQNATFPTDKLEITRQQFLTELKVELDDPAILARRVFQQSIYPENHPFHSFPTEASLQSIKRDDILNFYQNHYRPDTIILSLLGDFDPNQVRSLLESQLGNWKATGTAPELNFPSVELPLSMSELHEVIPGKAQAVTLMGYKGINRSDPRYYAALVLNQILGGDTLASRLGTEIRDRLGLTYGIYSYFQAGLNSGPFLIQMQTAPEDANRAIARTIELVQKMHDNGVTEAEVRAAQRSLTSSYTVTLAETNSLAYSILMNEVYGLGSEQLRQFPSKIQSVTTDQVSKSAQELLHPDHLLVVTAGPSTSATR